MPVANRSNAAYNAMMLENSQIAKIARQVATANLSSSAVVTTVTTAPFTDSEGRDALRITIVLSPVEGAKIEGDATLDTLVQIQEHLLAAGEERFPLLEYATENEVTAGGDS
ncbi:hypothetical protein [Bradyrhizobium sp. STM 3843]|uniref:hypothetical protein n=1 Tax=Bradyrhizobium sp. STM 3843 TaxID=551947 RepID=UPI0002F5AFC5|nr:hypothetical protein [Bradyrhizobium sp. STM 3843]